MTIEQLANQGVFFNLPWASLAIGGGLTILVLIIGSLLPRVFKPEHLLSVPMLVAYILLVALVVGIMMLAGSAFEIFFGHFGISFVNYLEPLSG